MTFEFEMKGITKRFGGVLANDSINFKVKKGEIHALVGENGAGKSTLMKILYGLYQPDSGNILINGKEKSILSPSDAISLGIGMVHQHFMLVGTLTVLENIILGDEDVFFGGILNLSAARKRLEELIKTFRLNIDLNSKVENLPVGLQQKIEILKILYRKSGILIFDEPTAVLTPQETDELFTLMKNLKQDGKTIILITHKLGEVLSVSDSVTVLRHGKVVSEKNISETNQTELAEMIVGGLIPPVENKLISENSKVIISVKNLIIECDTRYNIVNGVYFEIHSNEIFGIAGVEGNGQTELVEAINGLREIKSGEIKFYADTSHLCESSTRRVVDQTPLPDRQAGLQNGDWRNSKKLSDSFPPLFKERGSGGEVVVSHIPADRHKHGMVKEYKLFENVLLGRQNENRFRGKIVIKENALIDYTKKLIEKYDVRPVNPQQITGSLSGGNQQKLVVSRELTKGSDLVIASHPTRGLDIKAASFVLNALIEERNKGKAIILVSSDLSELLQISDRIGVMYGGKIIAVLNPSETNEREIGMYMTCGK